MNHAMEYRMSSLPGIILRSNNEQYGRGFSHKGLIKSTALQLVSPSPLSKVLVLVDIYLGFFYLPILFREMVFGRLNNVEACGTVLMLVCYYIIWIVCLCTYCIKYVLQERTACGSYFDSPETNKSVEENE